MTPPGLTAYRLLTTAATPLLPLVLKRRLRQGKEHAVRWRERLGVAGVARPPGPLIWLHGASVGEGLSLLPLAQVLAATDDDLTVLVTTGTVTSAELLGKRLPPRAIHQFAPVDAPNVAARFLDHWRPDLAVFAESEIWPNLLQAARARGVPMALISARLSKKSLANWARMHASAQAIFGGFDTVLAQDDLMAADLIGLGARDDGRLNLKLSGPPLAADAETLAAAQAALGAAPVLVAASTHPGEEAIVLDAFTQLASPDAVLLLVPRHPERGPAVAELAAGRGLKVGRRAAGAELDTSAPVYVADTLGEVGTWLSLTNTRAAFIGGSLLPGPGGHNPLEPARLGVPVITGPHVQNWSGVYAELAGEGAVTVRDAGDLAQAFSEVLNDRLLAQARGERGRTLAHILSADLETVADDLLMLAGGGDHP